ncbi:MAG: LTA synthase family protein [Lachnospiraceae bacterium]|nr:LTA synthase family protein [Lachnospiraceae bacterium]
MKNENSSTREKSNNYISIAGLILCPIVHFYLLEAYTHNGFAEVRFWSQCFNIVLFEWFALILFFLLRNLKWALRAEGIFAMVIGLVNYYVYSFRSLPLVPWDLLSVGTAASVADRYDFTPNARILSVLAGFAAILFLERFCGLTLKKWKWYASLLPALALCIGLGSFARVLQQEDFQNRHRMYNKLFTPVFMWQVNGLALTMVMELPYLAVEKPAGYEKKEAREILAEYETASQDAEVSAGISGISSGRSDLKPNIIVIMDEAFSDLGVLGDFLPSEDYMPYLHSIRDGAKENTLTGYLNVSVCGGNTANTEFEYLTGNTMAFLPQGSIPYQQYIKKAIPALPSYLQTLGYETYAMHPFNADGWDRDKVYPLLGFEHLAFVHDFNEREYIRKFVSDQSCVDQIIKTYEQKESGTPMFVFLVTMQNHGSYGDVYEDFTPHITVEGTSSYALSTYLSLISETDKAIQNLLSYFSKEEEPALVVFFGDHQPNDVVAEPILRLNGMSYHTLSEEETMLRYQVPYLIWANYSMPEGLAAEDTSANYLGQKTLKAAGLPLPPYQKFLDEMSESYPILTAVRTEVGEDIKTELEKYRKLQYYQLFDSQSFTD